MTATPTLPQRVKAFLVTNQDEQLTAYDVSVKFSTAHKNVHTQLARAVDSGELIRSRNDDGEYVYTIGAALLSQPATAKAVSTAQPAPRKPRAHTVDIDLLSLPIASNMPIPGARPEQGHHAAAALDRLTQPGQSFGVPLNANGRSALRKAITERHSAGTHRYVARTLETEFRIWRKA